MKPLINIINEHLLEKQEKRYHGAVSYFYPSSIGQCPRAVVFSMLGYPKKVSERLLMIFENGNSFHNRMERIFKDAGILIIDELSFRDEAIGVSGRSDAVIQDLDYVQVDGEDTVQLKDRDGNLLYDGPVNKAIIVELKSINDYNFNNKIKEPKEEHVKQLQLYMHITGLRKGILLYENKNNQELKEFSVDYDQKLANTVIREIQFVTEHAKNGTLPEKTLERSSFQCRYCDYKDICWPYNTVSVSLDQLL